MKHQISAIKELNEETPCDVYLCEDSTKVIQGNTTKVGKPIISCAIGTSCYHGLCDIGASISVIPYSLYLENKPDIDPIHMEETGITIQLANKEVISPLGMVRDVEVLVERLSTLLILLYLVAPKMHFVLLYLVDLSYILWVLKLVYQKRKYSLNVLEKD
jgi:hypothetical protein